VKARVTEYAGVQLRDYLLGRAPLVVVLTGLAAWGYAASSGLTVQSFDSSAGVAARGELERAFHVSLAAFAFLAAALAVHGLVARHRRRGYDRVIFSRPIDPGRYYAQGFVLAGLGGVFIGTAAAEVYGIAVHAVSLPGVAAYVALGWLSIGGLAFLLSTLTTFHVPLLVLLLGADFALDRYAGHLQSAGVRPDVLAVAQYVLPPGHVVASLSESFARGFELDPRVLIWPVSFGVACLIAALLLLRKRPFGS
jgi:hypothetical protein